MILPSILRPKLAPRLILKRLALTSEPTSDSPLELYDDYIALSTEGSKRGQIRLTLQNSSAIIKYAQVFNVCKVEPIGDQSLLDLSRMQLKPVTSSST